MSNLDKFSLFSGVLGVIVDSAAIIGYLTGLVNFGSPHVESTSNRQAPLLFILLLAIIIIYSWVSISWVIAKRTAVQLELAKKRYDLSLVISRTVFGVGLVIVPLILGWFVVTRLGTLGTGESEPRKRAIIYATQTAQVLEIPAYATRISKTQEAGGQVVIQESVDAIEQRVRGYEIPAGFFIYGFVFPISTIMLGLLVYGIIYQLLPLIHTEILKETDVYESLAIDEDDAGYFPS